MRPHERLDAWKKAMDLVETVYRITATFPSVELYDIVAQLRRAVVSVPANLAEGAARESRLEKRRFIITARASLAEVETLLEISRRLGYVGGAEADRSGEECQRVSALLQGLLKSLQQP